MLTTQQVAHFETFGFLFLPQLFSTDEIAEIRRKADALWREERGGGPDEGAYQHVAPFLESSLELSSLVEDDRIYLTVERLLGAGFVWGGSEGNKGSFNETQSHGWHCDRPGEEDPDYVRIKIMLYLTATTKDTGALRVMPGSHRPPLYHQLQQLNHIQSKPDEMPFGVPGPELPSCALEVEPGDAVFFNHYLYHAVFGKQPDRRYIALKFAAMPTSDRHFEALRKHGAFSFHRSFTARERPRIRQMIEQLPAEDWA